MGECSGNGNGESGIGQDRGALPSAQTLCLRDSSLPARALAISAAPRSDSRFPIPDSRPRPRRTPRQAGFTLLEVLIALLILSLVLVALIRAAGLQAQALNHHRDSTLAQWVAANVAAELRAEGAPSVGRQQGETRMGTQRWRWLAETSDTDVERLRRIEITVYEAGADSLAGSDADPVARLTAFATP
jgi:type II secretion system protein I